MSFLNQLKTQAHALRSQQNAAQMSAEARVAQTEAACQTVAAYLADLAQQLNVITPPAAAFTLDGKTPWPAMKMADFRCDVRQKRVHHMGGMDVTDYIGMGWRVLPQDGPPVKAAVSVNFPPELERVEARLALGHLKHDRREQRHPDTNKLQAIVFEHELAARASVLITPNHDEARLQVRLAGVVGLDTQTTQVPATAITTAWLDDLAKAIVGQVSSWG